MLLFMLPRCLSPLCWPVSYGRFMLLRVALNGVLVDPQQGVLRADDPALTVGWSVFETLKFKEGVVVDFARHLQRLERSAAAALIDCPAQDVLKQEILTLIDGLPGDLRIRLTLTGGGERILGVSVFEAERWHCPVSCSRGVHRDDPFLDGSVKRGSRASWVVAVQRAAVDEIVLVDADDRFTEGTSSAILAVIDGVLWTAPHDGRILASNSCKRVLRRASVLGVDIVRQGPPAYGPWDALYIASTTRGLCPVTELDGQPLPGWDDVGTSLVDEQEG